MGRYTKQDKIKYDEDLRNGIIFCRKCNQYRETKFFYRQYKEGVCYYKSHKCSICSSKKGKEIKSVSNEIKTQKSENCNELSKDCKVLLERAIYMKGWLDLVEVYKLCHYHIETFDYVDRNLNIEEDINLMFRELLHIYRIEQRKNNI